MAMAEVAEEEAMAIDVAPPAASEFTMLQAEQQFNLTLLEEHRVAVAQLKAERADAAAVAELLASPGILDEKRTVLAFVKSHRPIDRERRQLRINNARL